MDKKDIKKLVKEIKKSDKFDEDKMFDLYGAWFLGEESIPNEKKARAFFEDLLEDHKDDTLVKYIVAKCYMEAKDIKNDFAKAEQLLLELVKERPGLYITLGNLYEFDRYGIKDYAKAMEYYKKGNTVGCLYALGRMHEMGVGMKVCEKKALEYYLKAYEIDPKYDLLACNIGDIYLFGNEEEGLKPNAKKAEEYLLVATEVNPKFAYGSLGWMYACSNLVKLTIPNLDKGMDYLFKAAKLGNARAHYNIANIMTYENLNDKTKNPYYDIDKATEYAITGARMGDKGCIELCNKNNVKY